MNLKCMRTMQVSVASADGFAFGPIAACSAIEAARESAAQANNPCGDAAVGRRLSLAFTGNCYAHNLAKQITAARYSPFHLTVLSLPFQAFCICSAMVQACPVLRSLLDLLL